MAGNVVVAAEEKNNHSDEGQILGSNGTSNKTSEKQSELSKYWKTVNDNPSDFTGWTYLLQFVEQQKIISQAREAFDAFLSKYPYCFGYWRKLAEMERKYRSTARCQEVYEDGVKAVPLSVDLWLHYINFLSTAYNEDTNLITQRRNLYERAITAAGMDFRSDKIWESYITFEESEKQLVTVTAIYDRLLATPTQLYSQHLEKFKKHVDAHHPRDILTLDDFLKLRQDVLASKKSFFPSDIADETDPTTTYPPGSEIPPGAATGDGPPGEDNILSEVFDESEVPSLRAHIISQREDIYSNNEMEVSRRWAFEEAIKRPYFHVKPLERSQLKNWREYLDYEIKNGSHDRVIILFERCVIACALYDEFWLKYACYMELHNQDEVRGIYMRACHTHLPKKSSIFFAWSAFEERLGNVDAAIDTLTKLETNCKKSLISTTLRKIGIYRRKGMKEKVTELFENSIKDCQVLKTKNFYLQKYARYLSKIIGDVERSRQLLKDAIDNDPTNTRLYLQLLDTEYQLMPVDVDQIDNIFHTVLSATDIPTSSKIQFSLRRVDFLEDFGNDVQKIITANTEHQKYVKEAGSERKRHHHESSTDEIHVCKEKKTKESAEVKTKTVDSSAQISYPNNHITYSTSYGTQSFDHSASAAYYQQWAGYAPPPQGYTYNQWSQY